MTAKHKLNAAVICGVFLISSVLGSAAESWLVFLVAAGVMIALKFHDGSLRG